MVTAASSAVSGTSYDKVRFIGHAIPTTPAQLIGIGDPNGSGMVVGAHVASEDFDADIRACAAVLKAAADTAKAALADEADPTVLNVFVAPEFFWHGDMGPYVHKPDDVDPADAILALMQEMLPADEYPDFLFVLGTVVTAEVVDIGAVFAASSTMVRNDVVRALGEAWLASAGPLTDVILDTLVSFIKSGHAYPVVEVRNRALVIAPRPLAGDGRVLTTEKYYDSNEDFLLWDISGKPVITEQMTAYPVIDPSGGDVKSSPFDPYSIFQVPGTAERIHLALEICLDHSDHRLRKSVARNRWAEPADGIDLHVIPSCGMKIHPSAVATRTGGWVFNCDGEYALGEPSRAGESRRGTVNGVECVYADHVNPDSPGYAAHTQLALVSTGPEQGEPRVPGARDAQFAPAPEVEIEVLPVAPTTDLSSCFAGGPGAVHVYGMRHPLPMRG